MSPHPNHLARDGRDTTMSTQEDVVPEPPETGFTVAKRLSHREWLNHPMEGWGEYIHLFPDPDNHRLWLFRSYEETGSKNRIVTSVPHASFGFNDRHNPVVRRRGGDSLPTARVDGVPVRRRGGNSLLRRDNRVEGGHGRYEHDGEPVRPRCWYLSGGEAETFLSFFDLMAGEIGKPGLTVAWYGDNGKELTGGNRLTEESLNLKYRTDGGKERRIVIQSVYEVKSQMFARFD